MVDNIDRAGPSLCQADIGKRVLYHPGSDKSSKRGTLRYYGVPEFAEGYWCGIELDEPTGKHNGYLYGIHYFQCEENRGVFVQANKVVLDFNPPKKTHKRTGSGGRIIPHSPIGQKEFFKSSPSPPVKKTSTPAALQKSLPSQAFNAKLRQLTAKGQKTPVQPLKAFGSEVGNVIVRKRPATAKPVRTHMRRSSSGENLNVKGLMNGRLVKSASSECVQKASTKEPSPKPFRRSSHENFTAVPHQKTSKGRVQRWPLTSTPVKGDTASTSSSSTSVISNGASEVEPSTMSDQQVSSSDVAFVQTPETPPRDSSSTSTAQVSSGIVSTDDSIIGLQTPVSQLKLQTQNSDFIDSNRVPSPEPHPPQERYQNNLSGSATLSHPLSSIVVKPTDTAATPTDAAATPTDIMVSTPTDTTTIPNDSATLPTLSANINGIVPLCSNSDDEFNQHLNRDLIATDKSSDERVSVLGGSCTSDLTVDVAVISVL